MGPSGGRRVDCRDPPCARSRRQLDRHGGRLRLRPLGERSSDGHSRASSSAPMSSPRLRCSRGGAGRWSTASSATRSCVRSGTVCAGSGVEAIDLYQIHWPVPEEDIEEGWSALAELKDQGSCGTSASRTSMPSSCAVSRRSPRSRLSSRPYSLIDREVERRDPAVRRAGGDRRDRLLADGLWPAERRDDARADRRAARRRLAQARRALPGAATLAPSRAWSSAWRPSRSATADAGRGGGRVDTANPAVDGAIVGARRPSRSTHCYRRGPGADARGSG